MTGATIVWSPPQNISGASDVSTEGTLFGSWAPYDPGAKVYPVNGVTFEGYDTLGIRVLGVDGGGPYFITHTTPDTNYNLLLAYGAYADGTASSYIINGTGSKPLTVGRQYLIQFWVSDPRPYGLSRAETVSGSSALGFQTATGMGQYVIGRFTADAVTQDLAVSANQSAQINLLQVRDVTPPPPSGPTAGGVANPANLVIGQTATVTVTVTNGANPTITNVTLDASSLGVTLPVSLNPAGGNVFTNVVTVGTGTVYGAQSLIATVTDAAGIQGRATIAVFLATPAPYRTPAASLEAWRSNRFGLFIHWGPVTLTGLEISWSRANSNPQCPNNGPTPVAVYDNLYTQFNPASFNATNWVAMAQAAGMKYVVLTAKHCDGFLLWDSKASDYNIMNSPFHRDVCGELAAAAHAAGMKLGWYYSPMDWKDPRFRNPQNADFIETMQAELRELLSNYGQIDLLWFDTDGYSNVYDVTNTYAMCRRLQPGMVINNRLDMGSMADYAAQAIGPWADYYTPEQRIGGFDNQQPWETCMTLGTQWAWKPNDTIKSLQECLSTLLRCAGGDGNFLFNLGPTATGEFEPRYIDRIAGMGAWLARYGESVYGTRGGPYQSGSDFASTRRDNHIYLHLVPPQQFLTLPALPVEILSATVLNGGKVILSQDGGSLALQFSPAVLTNRVATVKLTVAGSALDVPVLPAGVLSSPPITTSWQGPRAVAESGEVDTQGSLGIARQATGSDYGGKADQTVNGVTFLGNANTANEVTFSLEGMTGYDPNTFISTKTLTGPDATAYQNMLAGAWYGGGGPLTVAVSGLTVGNIYRVQFWVADFRVYPNARSETVTTQGGTDINPPTLHYLTGDGINPGSGSGQSVLGTFTATGPIARFTLAGNDSSQLNAFQLRDISPPRVSCSVGGNDLILSWPTAFLGWTMLAQTNHLDRGVSPNSSDWMRLPGTETNTQFRVPLDGTNRAGYYRLMVP
jgi:hypothetical protein